MHLTPPPPIFSMLGMSTTMSESKAASTRRRWLAVSADMAFELRTLGANQFPISSSLCLVGVISRTLNERYQVLLESRRGGGGRGGGFVDAPDLQAVSGEMFDLLLTQVYDVAPGGVQVVFYVLPLLWTKKKGKKQHENSQMIISKLSDHKGERERKK